MAEDKLEQARIQVVHEEESEISEEPAKDFLLLYLADALLNLKGSMVFWYEVISRGFRYIQIREEIVG